MGNGALPHGPSYRAHPRLYLSGGSQGGEFTSAFGRAAEVHGRTTSVAFDVNDPTRKCSVHRSSREFLVFAEGEEAIVVYRERLQSLRHPCLTDP